MKKTVLSVPVLSVAILAMLAVTVTGCKERKQTQEMPPQGAVSPSAVPGGTGTADGFGMPASPHGEVPAEKKIVVSDEVRKSWKAVKISLEFKEKKETKQFVVPLNSEFRVPGTGLTLKTGAFFPHFKMEPGVISSASNDPVNPAVQIDVYEAGKEIFHGWLFAKFPGVHAFSHDKYAIALVEGIRK